MAKFDVLIYTGVKEEKKIFFFHFKLARMNKREMNINCINEKQRTNWIIIFVLLNWTTTKVLFLTVLQLKGCGREAVKEDEKHLKTNITKKTPILRKKVKRGGRKRERTGGGRGGRGRKLKREIWKRITRGGNRNFSRHSK